MDKKTWTVIVIGNGSIGSQNIIKLKEQINILNKENMTEKKISFGEIEPFKITKLPKFEELPIDSIFNYKKHKETCEKKT